MSYWILFLWAFLSATILPIASEPYFVAILKDKEEFILPVLVASVANILGSLLMFFLARKGERMFVGRSKNHASAKDKLIKSPRILAFVEKYGPFALFFGWVPFVGDLLVVAGGVFQLPVAKSILWIAVGKVFRYALIAYLFFNFP